MKKQLILASNSPRRKELLQLNDIEFTVKGSNCDETLNTELELPLQIEDLAFRKANSIYQDNQDCVVIGADTIVTIDNEILGKPKDEEDAKKMLQRLSGKTHQVITAVSIISSKETIKFHSITNVEFYELTEKEIDDYVATKEPLDKAGAYGIQGKGCRLIRKINGDYYTVMGLPIAEVLEKLEKVL